MKIFRTETEEWYYSNRLQLTVSAIIVRKSFVEEPGMTELPGSPIMQPHVSAHIISMTAVSIAEDVAHLMEAVDKWDTLMGVLYCTRPHLTWMLFPRPNAHSVLP